MLPDRSSFFANLADALRDAAESDWTKLARPNQLAPGNDWWRIWLLLAGRGFGKTRTLCEWVRAQIESGASRRIALVGATASDCRDVLVEGESGILAISPRHNRPVYEPSKRRLTWPGGQIATCYSADEPERLRGPQHDAAACDELAAWRYPESWDMLMMGLRIGTNPRCVVATTPKPVKLLRELLKREGKDVVVTRGSTLENATNLAPQFLESITARYRGTRLGRQELDGEMLEDVPGAMWTREVLDATRVELAPPLQRIVIAVDPAGSSAEGADETGIIAAGLGSDDHGYIVADLSGRYAPTEWARKAIAAFHSLRADRIVVERNYGGEMAKATLESVDSGVPVTEISSSRGKVLRAEPISSLFEQRRAHVVGTLPGLEDQMCGFTSDWKRERDGSPDRVDAAVFALTELMLGLPQGGYFKDSLFLGDDGTPIEVPIALHRVYTVVVPSTAGDTVASLVFAESGYRRKPPLIILDYDLCDLADMSAKWPALLESMKAGYAWGRNAPLQFPPFIFAMSGAGVGSLLLKQATAQGLKAFDLDAQWKAPLPPAVDDRVTLGADWLFAGKVKISTQAYERQVTHRGVTRNHLLAQLLAYARKAEDPAPTELVEAVITAVCVVDPNFQKD